MSNEWLTTGLRNLGLTAGDAVLVHSSMKGLGYIDGGPPAVIDALLHIVGSEGTVLFPTLTGNRVDGPTHPPSINLSSTPCARFVGIVPEAARQHPGAIRSIHPTHSAVALGANQIEWTSGHETGRSPCDEASPYFRLMEQGGKILLLGGVTHDSNTSLHCLEELADVPYHLQNEVTNGTVELPGGEVITVPNQLHLARDLYSHLQLPRKFNKVSEPLIAAGFQRSATIGQTSITLIDARGMRDVLIPILKQDPLFLLQRS